ncbi:HlyU family transcriptional regulator [Motiliproteus sp. SC1-56]|uniref:HlyU family transcriptional regulator n=1 Tax=Motiliproteus sp. SC1-56 TaxID=2799565 RepID=UPI001A8D047D|nr:HlyU family transcriptional regulator [Motiliproteus sp. SC1-56]
MLANLIRKLFGGASETPPAPEQAEVYNGYEITPCPQPADGQFRIAAFIRKDGREHHLIRADILPTRNECIEHSLRKARTLIDQQGERLFEH